MLQVPTILVVDDEPLVRGLTRRVLDTAGYKVVLANDGVSAMEQLRAANTDIDLVLLDVVMPGQNGREVLESIADEFPKTRFLFMSGFTANAMSGAFFRENGYPFLQKPFQPDDLVDAVYDALHS